MFYPILFSLSFSGRSPKMTEILLSGTLSLNQSIKIKIVLMLIAGISSYLSF